MFNSRRDLPETHKARARSAANKFRRVTQNSIQIPTPDEIKARRELRRSMSGGAPAVVVLDVDDNDVIDDDDLAEEE